MSKHLLSCLQRAIGLGLAGLLGCQSEPTLPDTLIPPGCRLSFAQTIQENYSGDSTTYQYDTFGHLVQLNTTRRAQGRIVRQASSTYTYDTDHYLILRTDRTATYYGWGSPVVDQGGYTYEYAGQPKQIYNIRLASTGSAPAGTPRTIAYQYTGSQLSEYREVAMSGEVANRVIFGGDGRVSQRLRTGFSRVDLSNGLITRTVNGRDTTLYSYDGSGQPTMVTSITGATGERIERTYTYDNRQPTRTGELKLRGFPDVDVEGYGQVRSNVLTETIRQYRNGFITDVRVLRYTYAFNNQGYVTGYTRSDGVRARFYYTNCP